MKRHEQQDVQEIIEGLDVNKLLGKRFLVTGATGSLARYMVHVLMQLSEQNPKNTCKVVVLCRSKEKAINLFREYVGRSYFKIIEGKVEDEINYEEELDYIVHAACISATAYFHSNPVEIITANTIGTYRLLQLAHEKKVRGFLFFSSGAVYGGATPDDCTYLGIDSLNSTNCYALSKKMGENMCAAYHKEYGIPAKIVRIGYTYGPHIDIDDGHLYSDFVKAVINNTELIIRGDGQKSIGLTYVTDAVKAFFIILLKGKPNTPYVLRNHKTVATIEEIAKRITTEAFPERNLTYRCLEISQKNNKHEEVRSPELIMQLGWKPKIGIVEGFRKTVYCIEEGEVT